MIVLAVILLTAKSMTGLVIVKHMASRGGHKNTASPYLKYSDPSGTDRVATERCVKLTWRRSP